MTTRRLREGVSATDTDYGRTLLDLDSGEYFNLNPTGALVLHRLLEGDSPTQAAARLSEEFPVALEDARQDVADLVAALEAAGLIETVADAARSDGGPPRSRRPGGLLRRRRAGGPPGDPAGGPSDEPAGDPAGGPAAGAAGDPAGGPAG